MHAIPLRARPHAAPFSFTRAARRTPHAHTCAPQAPPASAALGDQVLSQLRRIIDPDFGEDIVACGFVKDLTIDEAAGAVSFKLELTTPACPVKDQFKREATQYVQVGQAAKWRAGCSQQQRSGGEACWEWLAARLAVQAFRGVNVHSGSGMRRNLWMAAR